MLGVGWTEMLVIGVVALIVIGPKELPAVMQRIGKFAGTIRRMGGDFQRELNKTTGLNEITNLRNSVTQPLKATAEAIRKEFNTTTAAGKVEPSGALKPADPKVESVVDEIKAKAGMASEKPAPLPFTAAAAAAMAKGAEPKASEPVEAVAIVTAPVKARRAPRVKLPADTPVEAAELPAAKAKPATVKTAAAKTTSAKPAPGKPAKVPATSAPAEAAAAKQKTTKPKATKPAAAEPTASAKAPAAKPARAKPASKPADPASSATAPKPASRARKPATKKA